MTERTIPRALVLTGIILDVLIVLIFLFMPRSGMEAMGAAFMLFPLAAIRLLVGVVALVLSVQRRNWQLGLYTALAMVVLGWFWLVGESLEPTWEPLHKVLRIEAKAQAIRFNDYLDKRAYDAKRAAQHKQNPQHGKLCDLLSVERDLQALDAVLDQDLNRPCATYDGDDVSPLLHAVVHTYGFWTGDMRAHPPKDETFLGPAAQRLLSAGADPDAQDAFGNTALHYGLTFQNAGLVDALLSHNACILLKNGLDESPLTNHSSHRLRKKIETAATNPLMLANCPENLRGLSGHEAHDKAVSDDLRTPDAGLLHALRSGRLDRAIYYLEQGADPDAGDHEGSSFESALRNCRDNAPSLAQLLLDAGADINGQNRRGESALMISMRYCVDVVPFLLERGADPTLGDRKGDTPLHHLGGVAPERLKEIVGILIAAGADVNQQSGTGQTALIRSLFGGASRTRVFSALLERGADLNLTDRAGNSMLHILASRKRDEDAPALMATLIERGAAIELQNRKQQTPLVAAVEQGNPEAVRVLIEAGAEVNVRRTRGNTLISGLISCQPEKLAKLELLVDAGADISIPIKHGSLPLEQAFLGKIYLDCLEPAQILLNAGADPNQLNDNGAAAIHKIATWVDKDPEAALSLLRKNGADIDLRNEQGMTALLLAARYGTSIRTLERLLAHGADPNARDDKGNSLLHTAAMNSKDGNLARYNWVLAAGGNPGSKNKAGQTPLDRARITGNDALVQSISAP